MLLGLIWCQAPILPLFIFGRSLAVELPIQGRYHHVEAVPLRELLQFSFLLTWPVISFASAKLDSCVLALLYSGSRSFDVVFYVSRIPTNATFNAPTPPHPLGSSRSRISGLQAKWSLRETSAS